MADRGSPPIGALGPDDVRDAGVRCPRCECRHCPAGKVRHFGRVTQRQRTCRHCGKQFWTREIVEEDRG